MNMHRVFPATDTDTDRQTGWSACDRKRNTRRMIQEECFHESQKKPAIDRRCKSASGQNIPV